MYGTGVGGEGRGWVCTLSQAPESTVRVRLRDAILIFLSDPLVYTDHHEGLARCALRLRNSALSLLYRLLSSKATAEPTNALQIHATTPLSHHTIKAHSNTGVATWNVPRAVLQAAEEWQSTMSTCKAIWRELRGVPLLPLANGKAGTFAASMSIGGGQKYILGTRRQQGLMPQLKGRFVHPKASRRLQKFFSCDDFLQVWTLVVMVLVVVVVVVVVVMVVFKVLLLLLIC